MDSGKEIGPVDRIFLQVPGGIALAEALVLDVRQLGDYRRMMADDVRMRAYQKAISLVCPGAIVCEIGVGLGPLSLMALEAGAERVYGIELDAAALSAATEVIRAHGHGPERFIPLQGLSERIELPERVDVIVSETLDSIGIGENTARYMADAKRRFLCDDGVFLPSRLECFFALAHPRAYVEELAFWVERMKRYGMTFEGVADAQRCVKHTLDVQTHELLSEWTPWLDLRFDDPATFARVVPVLLEATRSGSVSGIATAFDATLAPGVHLRTFPEDPSTHWLRGFQPMPHNWIELGRSDLVYVEADVSSHAHPSVRCELRIVSGKAGAVRQFASRRAATLLSAAPESSIPNESSILVP